MTSEREVAAILRWQLQNEAAAEMPDDVREKTAKEMAAIGRVATYRKISTRSDEFASFHPAYFSWALRVGAMAVDDEVAPCAFVSQSGEVRYGIAVWRQKEGSVAGETVVE